MHTSQSPSSSAASAPSGAHVLASERSVWTGAELDADPDWRHTMSAAEVDELIERAREAVASGLKVGEFTRRQFPLPLLGPQIEALVDGVENGRGVGLLHGFPVGELDDETLRVA